MFSAYQTSSSPQPNNINGFIELEDQNTNEKICVPSQFCQAQTHDCDSNPDSRQCQDFLNYTKIMKKKGYRVLGCYTDSSCSQSARQDHIHHHHNHYYPYYPYSPYYNRPFQPYWYDDDQEYILPPYQNPSGNACSTQEKSICYRNHHYYPSPYDDDDYNYNDYLYSHTACIPAKVGHGSINDGVCWVGWDDPCHLVSSGEMVCPLSCVARCCPGNK